MIPTSAVEAAPGAPAPNGLHQLSLILLLAACFIDGADVQLLPASFRALEADLGFAPVNLGQLAMVQALFCACLAPFWASVADMELYPKKFLLGVAVLCW